MKKMTVEQAMDAIRDAVDERGYDFKYSDMFGSGMFGDSRCRNVVDGRPACLVGLALWRFGEKNGLPEKFMLSYPVGTSIRLAERLKEDGILNIGKKAQLLLRIAQDVQDECKSWGDALTEAYRVYRAMEYIDM